METDYVRIFLGLLSWGTFFGLQWARVLGFDVPLFDYILLWLFSFSLGMMALNIPDRVSKDN